MKVVTANRLSDGRVVYLGADDRPVDRIRFAARLEGEAAEAALVRVASQPEIFVDPHLVDIADGRPSGRDRLKEFIRSTGPTVGHSLEQA